MAVRPSNAVSRLAVERARVRMPGLAPDSVEVVELTRGQIFVIVRTIPDSVIVLDERGRLVRGRERLVTIARHSVGLASVRAAVEEARLERRWQHVEHSIALLGAQRRIFGRTAIGTRISGVVADLETLRDCLRGVRSELDRYRELRPTERTLRRTVALLNEAAEADRGVVRATRRLASDAGQVERLPVGASALRRWLLARLASSDLPFFYWELDELESRRSVESFVASAVSPSR